MKKNILLLCLFSLQFLTLAATADEAARAAAILPGTTVLLINQDVSGKGPMADKLKSISQSDSMLSKLTQKVPAGRSGKSSCMMNAFQNLSKEKKECKSLYMQVCSNYPQGNDFCVINELNTALTLQEIKKEIAEQASKAGKEATFKDGTAAGIPFIEVAIEEVSDAIALVEGGKTILAARPANVLQDILKRYQARQSVALTDRMSALRASAKAPATSIAQVLVDITPEMQKKLVDKANDAENPMMGAAMEPCSKLTGFAMSLSLEDNALPLNLLFQAGNATDATAFKTQFLDGMVLPMLPSLAPMMGITTPLNFVNSLKAAQEGNVATLTTAFTISDIDTIATLAKKFAAASQE
ncbi:MAG: hypothetical protein IJJ33_06480 [Victivallales bacterium]|nr:hypothetical protein [Victivallales bacterium]